VRLWSQSSVDDTACDRMQIGCRIKSDYNSSRDDLKGYAGVRILCAMVMMVMFVLSWEINFL
jgi:hypothetical protein